MFLHSSKQCFLIVVFLSIYDKTIIQKHYVIFYASFLHYMHMKVELNCTCTFS